MTRRLFTWHCGQPPPPPPLSCSGLHCKYPNIIIIPTTETRGWGQILLRVLRDLTFFFPWIWKEIIILIDQLQNTEIHSLISIRIKCIKGSNVCLVFLFLENWAILQMFSNIGAFLLLWNRQNVFMLQKNILENRERETESKHRIYTSTQPPH